jgi:hypothetical protein
MCSQCRQEQFEGNEAFKAVADLLQADAAPPEATFNNVIDMLRWLNRD